MVLAGSGWCIAPRLEGFDGAAVLAVLTGLTVGQVVIALAAVATAFAAVAGQERAVVAYLGLSLPAGRAGRAAAAAAAVAQTVGFGPVVGALVRRRLLGEVTLGQSFAISAWITLGFFVGLGLLILVSFAVLPGLPFQALAQAALVAVMVVLTALALSRRPIVMRLRKPNLFILGRFLFWLTLDLGALTTALWVVLPPQVAPPFWTLLPVFLLALGLGIASGSPGGVGPFEATLLVWLPQVDAAGLVAGILTFRVLAYAIPALCGAVWAMARPGRAVAVVVVAPDAVAEIARLPPEAQHGLPSAEAQLIRQGGLTLLAMAGGQLWLSGRLALTRVMLGRVMADECGRPDRSRMLGVVERLAKAEARMPCLYKVDARMAAAARARGYAVLPVAHEAVLDPLAFHLAGPERARLRRKLAHARKAGVLVEDSATPPLAEMEEVAATWQAAHGCERGFSMGRWEQTYAAGQRVITARDTTGSLIAFVTFHTGRSDWVLDLVRFRPGAPDGTIYAMIIHALEMARWHEVRILSLAAVPDAAFGLTGPLARIARRATRGSVGLARFKSAFAPRWRVLYVAGPSRLALLIGGLEVARAILRPAPLAKGRQALVVLDGVGLAAGEPLQAGRAARELAEPALPGALRMVPSPVLSPEKPASRR